MLNEPQPFRTGDANYGASVGIRGVWRFKVTTVVTDAPDPDVLMVKAFTYNGTQTGSREYIIVVLSAKNAGDEVFATKPEGGAGGKYGAPAKQVIWRETGSASPDNIGKVTAYEPGENQVTLQPCTEDGTAIGEDTFPVKITMPVNRTQCSIVSIMIGDILLYRKVGSIKYLSSVPLPISTIEYDVLGIRGDSGNAGFDDVQYKG